MSARCLIGRMLLTHPFLHTHELLLPATSISTSHRHKPQHTQNSKHNSTNTLLEASDKLLYPQAPTSTHRTMPGARHGLRVAKAIARVPLIGRIPLPNPGRPASTSANSSESMPPSVHLSDLESTTTFSSPDLDRKGVESFAASQSSRNPDRRLPGSRYQYHPPKYYRGPLHPVQVPPSSDPTARDFVSGPFSLPRLRQTYESTVAPDLMTLTYTHIPPGSNPSVSLKGVLREWDGSSPYHKNRPRRGPRGSSSSRLGLLERPITWNNIPRLSAVTVHSYTKLTAQSKEYLHVTRAVLQAITGSFPEVRAVKSNIIHWGLRKGEKAAAVVTLKGASAWEFVDKLVTLVLPKIKDWPGIKGSSGDDSGNIAFGLVPEWMAYFPEIEHNYDLYPSTHLPGCHIILHTTGTSDKQGRLFMQALGFPFYGTITH